MAVTRVKRWVSNEILTASDLNAEFDNILNYGQSIGFPRTSNADFAGYTLILDADGDSNLRASTDDEIDIRLGGTDLFNLSASGMTFKGSRMVTVSDILDVKALIPRVSTIEGRTSGYKDPLTVAEMTNF